MTKREGKRTRQRFAAKFGLADYWLEADKWPDFCREKDLPFDCKKKALAVRMVRKNGARER